MGNSNGNNSIKAFFQRPLWASVFIKRNKVTSQENQETVNSLSVSQMNRMIFVSVFLTLLAIAYFIMFYAYNLHPDDIFFSKIAMYLLLFSSFSYALIAILAYVKNIHKPRMARFLQVAIRCLFSQSWPYISSQPCKALLKTNSVLLSFIF